MVRRDAVAVVAETEDFYSAGVAAVLEHRFGYATVLTARTLDQLLTIFATVSVSPVSTPISAMVPPKRTASSVRFSVPGPPTSTAWSAP